MLQSKCTFYDECIKARNEFTLEIEGILEECGEAFNQCGSLFISKKLGFSNENFDFRVIFLD